MIKTFRFRLTAWNVGFFALLLVLFSLFLYGVMARSLVARLDDKLGSQADTATALLQDEIHEANGDLAKAAAETVAEMSLGHAAIEILADGTPLAGDALPQARRAVRHLTLNGRSLDIASMESMDPVDSTLRIVRRVIWIALPLFLLLAGIGG